MENTSNHNCKCSVTKHLVFLLSFAIVFIFAATLLGAQQAQNTSLPPQYATAQYELLDSWYETLGAGPNIQKVAKYKLRDIQNDTGFIVTVDENANILESGKELEKMGAISTSKLHPRLVERFMQGTTKLIESDTANAHEEIVHVWLVDPTEEQSTSSLQTADVSADNKENESYLYRTAEEMRSTILANEQKIADVRASFRGHFNAVIQNFIQETGISEAKVLYRYQYAPAIILRLTYTECLDLEKSSFVNYLFPDEESKKELDKIASASKGLITWYNGYDGTGVKIAHIESEPGKMQTGPYLSATIYRPSGSVHYHPTIIGGIICSTHLIYTGIAYGCTLLNANAASNTESDIVPAAEWAIDQGACVLNMSESLKDTSDGTFDWSDIYFDYLAYNNHVLFTKSAGNEGDGTGVVTSPGRGYNCLTVGNIDGKGTIAWSDDVIHFSSSYVDPASGTDKPEIAAYGTDVFTHITSNPWVGEGNTGTSFSAPLVAGIAGLIIGRTGFNTWPEIVKAMILVSGLSHNIEGDSKMSDKDGAGAALATAAIAVSGSGRTLTQNSFDASGYYELDRNIQLKANDPARIVLVYMHPPSSRTATPDPSSYYKSDFDLDLYIEGSKVASSSYSDRNPFEIIDYTPSSTCTARVKIKKYSWNTNISSIRIGVAWASRSDLGTSYDNIYPADFFVYAPPMPGWKGQMKANNTMATKEVGETYHANNFGGASLWWNWTAPANGKATIDTFGSSFDTLLAAYTGSSVGGLTQVAANDDGRGGPQSQMTFNALPGTTYHIVVDGYNAATNPANRGDITLNWNIWQPNDNFSSAANISGSYDRSQTIGSNVGATKEPGEPQHAGNSGGASVWWRWTAPTTGQVTIDTLESNFDTLLSIYTGNSVGSLAQVASNDDTQSSAQSLVTFTATHGIAYYIAVDGYKALTGNIILTISR
jgi:hypothetical protein